MSKNNVASIQANLHGPAGDRRRRFVNRLRKTPDGGVDRPVEYRRLNPWVLIVVATCVIVGASLIYRGGATQGSSELKARLMFAGIVWAVPMLLVVLPVGLRFLLRKRALEAAGNKVTVPTDASFTAVAEMDGTRGLLVLDSRRLVLLTGSGTGHGKDIALSDIRAACQLRPDHALWCMPGADILLGDGQWIELRAIDISPLLDALGPSGVRVLRCVKSENIFQAWRRASRQDH